MHLSEMTKKRKMFLVGNILLFVIIHDEWLLFSILFLWRIAKLEK